jgi:thiamine-monophosphate kinase
LALTSTSETHPKRVSELGEFGLIERFASLLGSAPDGEVWAGDDAAVVDTDGQTLFTTDVLVEGVDFELTWASGVDVGWKAMAVNASDLAAMGGRPTHAVVSLALPADTPVSVTDAIGEGLVEAKERWEIALVGGDVSRASEISIMVAMLGRCGHRVVLRSGAKVGDVLCVTGALGGAAAGLQLLRRGLAGPGPTEGRHVSPELAETCVRLAGRQLRPQARTEEGEALAEVGVHAMIDVSDGLLADAGHLVDAGGVAWSPTAEAPVDPDAIAVASLIDADPAEMARTGGEDFELLFACEPGVVDAARVALERLGTAVTVVGDIRERSEQDAQEEDRLGWDHLRGR